MCGFITVSSFSVYNEYYQGISEALGEWMYAQMESDLEALEGVFSESASASVDSMVSAAVPAPAEPVETVATEPVVPGPVVTVETVPVDTSAST